MTIPLKIYQVDAFSDKIFGGNPAAVLVLEEWLPEEVMQRIAGENNLAETAFLVKSGEVYEIRWFTPTDEVELCGHATLASAHVLYNYYNYPSAPIHFNTRLRGSLTVTKNNDQISLNFPVDLCNRIAIPELLIEALGKTPIDVFMDRIYLLVLFSNQQEIESIQPDFTLLNQLDAIGIIVTAPGDDIDFVSRFFAPKIGVNEDPVTGSAHTRLIPFWSKRLGKIKMKARQLSERRGELACELKEGRVIITGQATTYLSGEIHL